MSNKRSIQKSILLICGIVLLSFTVVYALEGFFPLGNGSIVALDLSNQYMPLLYRFYDVIINGKSVAVDLNLGGGINIFSDTITELLNPFNYFLLLFPREKLYLAVNLLVVLYSMAASVSAFCVMDRIDEAFTKDISGRLLSIGLAIAYGMSYYVAYQYEIIRWMYPVVLFPVFFLFLKNLLEGGKRYPFILLLAYELVLSFQFGVQLCLFTFVFSLCFFKDEKKDRSFDALNLGISVFCALMLSAFSTVPFVINLLGSDRTSQNNSLFTVVMHHGLDNILERIFEISSPVILGIILFSILVLKKGIKDFWEKNRALCMTFIILIITVILEPSNLLWHLGSYQCFPVRYGYIILFLGIIISRKLLFFFGEKSGKPSYISLFSIIPVIIGFAYVYMNRLSFAQAFATLDVSNACLKETLTLYGIMLLLTASVELCLFAFTFKNDRCVSLIMYIIVSAAVGMIWNMAIFLPQDSLARQYNEEVYKAMNDAWTYSDREIYDGHVGDKENYPLNGALISGENTMSAYIPSGEGMDYSHSMAAMGFETPWITVSSRGGNDYARTFLGIDGGLKGAILLPKKEADSIWSAESVVEAGLKYDVAEILFDHKHGKVEVNLGGKNIYEDAYSVFLPMAYIKGWSCSKGNISSYLGGFLRIDLNENPGDSLEKIEIEFTPPALAAGVIISLIGLALLLVAGVFFTPKGKAVEKIARTVFIALGCLFVLLVYILPNLGMVAFMGAKACGKDLSSFVQSIGSGSSRKNDNTPSDVLLATEWEEDGLRVYVGHENLLNSDKVKISASDTEKGDFKPDLVNDGDVTNSSRWSSTNDWENNEHYLQIDLRKRKTVGAVKIYWERTNVTDYSLEVSDNGKDWTEAVHNFEAPHGYEETIFLDTPIEARYIRIHSFDVSKNEEDLTLYYQNVSINEFQVFEAPCDSFLIETPKIETGFAREIPVPEVPSGYTLTPGGIDYDNLMKETVLADTLSDVDCQIGYTLSCGQERWDLPGFDVVIPSSSGRNDKFPYKTVSVKEFAAGDEVASNSRTVDYSDNDIITTFEDSSLTDLGDEGYEIRIAEDGSIKIVSKDEKGRQWAFNTLARMKKENSQTLPVGIIRDYPKYAVRGFVMDVARSPISMDLLYKIMTLMSENYMNTLQIHLNDNAIIASSDYDQTLEGARKLYSAFRLESDVTNDKGECLQASDGYYTKEEFARFISDAKEMGVDVVPEIDTPAHSLAITGLFPNLGVSDPPMADTLDLSKPEAVAFATALWNEYLLPLSSNSQGEAVFDECNALSLGMDEYYGDYTYYAAFANCMIETMKIAAPDKKIRIWGSLDYKEMYKGAIDSATQIMIWNMFWADPKKTYDEGFSIINCLSQDLYIIVGGGYDYLDCDHLDLEWEPNRFVDGQLREDIPAWSPRMLGACYSMWNDHNLGPQKAGFEGELFDRILQPIDILSKKLWD